MPEQVAPASPRGVYFFHCWCRQDTHYLPVSTTPPFIKFYMKSWAVNQCSERRRWRDEGGVQRGSQCFWKSCIVTNRCFDSDDDHRWCFCLIGAFLRLSWKGRWIDIFQGESCSIWAMRRPSWCFFALPPPLPAVHLEEDILMFHCGISGVHLIYGFINNVSGKNYQGAKGATVWALVQFYLWHCWSVVPQLLFRLKCRLF